jgi:hypothetical protein
VITSLSTTSSSSFSIYMWDQFSNLSVAVLRNHTDPHNWKDQIFAFPHLIWWEYLVHSGVCCILVLFAGLCSGLTLGLLSIDQMSLNIMLGAGTDKEKKYAGKLAPILCRHHLLLVTLLLWV